MYKDKEMRTVLVDILQEKMEQDESYVTVDADLARANGTLGLKEIFPDRALNVGIAEANMACVAAGLASYGFHPVIFSFCAFVTRRIYDQASVSISYAKQNVKIVGTDPGITAELNGGTHMSVEDVAIMRALPNMVIFEPVDAYQLAQAMPQIFDYEGALYLRLQRKIPMANYFDQPDYAFDLFTADVLREGTDVTLFATGIELHEAMEAAKELEKQGVSAEVINVHTIKPLDEKTIVQSVQKTGCAVTCENANVIGGLGGAIAEVTSAACPVPIRRIGIQDHFGEVGRLRELQEKFEMTAPHIVKAALDVLGQKK